MPSGLPPRPRSVTLGEGAFASTDATAITGEADAAALLIARVHRRTGLSLLAAPDAPTRQGWVWPAVTIDDAPRFAHRGLQGWRLALDSRPRLAEAASGSAALGDVGGCSSRADWQRILDAAASRHIAWSARASRSWESFRERLADLATRWDAENLAYRRIDDVPWRRP